MLTEELYVEPILCSTSSDEGLIMGTDHKHSQSNQAVLHLNGSSLTTLMMICQNPRLLVSNLLSIVEGCPCCRFWDHLASIPSMEAASSLRSPKLLCKAPDFDSRYCVLADRRTNVLSFDLRTPLSTRCLKVWNADPFEILIFGRFAFEIV